MGIKKFKPTTPSNRFTTSSDFQEITKSKPEKSLVQPYRKTGGRNNLGRMTARHIGGGHKRKFRTIDFRRDKNGLPAKVLSIEYDPNRSARIALVSYKDGEKRYIVAPVGLKVNDVIVSGEKARTAKKKKETAAQERTEATENIAPAAGANGKGE